jgi:hypothetical protein
VRVFFVCLVDAAMAERMEQEARDRDGLPPRPFPRLEPCAATPDAAGNGGGAAAVNGGGGVGGGKGNQSWVVSQGFPATAAPICMAGGSGLCWNIQGAGTGKLILWPRSSTENALFSVKGDGAVRTDRQHEQTGSTLFLCLSFSSFLFPIFLGWFPYIPDY